jgi:hypothetical protein
LRPEQSAHLFGNDFNISERSKNTTFRPFLIQGYDKIGSLERGELLKKQEGTIFTMEVFLSPKLLE